MRRSLTLVAACLLLLTLIVPALGQVRDQAGFFTPNAVERADQLISQIRQQTRHDIIVDTLPALSAEQQAQLQSVGKERFFEELTNQRAKQSGVTGVYVLITRDPSHLQVAVGNETARSGLFTTADRDHLRDTLLTNFRAKNYDQGLLDAVSYAQRTMTGNVASARSSGDRTLQTFPGASPNAVPDRRAVPEQRSGHGFLYWLLLLGGGGLLLMWLLRRLAARASTYSAGSGYSPSNVPPPLPGQPQQGYGSYPGYGAGSQGGGMGRSVLGGLLGGAAGGWLYDRVSHRHDTGTNYPGQNIPPTPSNPDAFPSSAPDTDFSSSSGGDFGDSSDFGGGDDSDRNSGGGDF